MIYIVTRFQVLDKKQHEICHSFLSSRLFFHCFLFPTWCPYALSSYIAVTIYHLYSWALLKRSFLRLSDGVSCVDSALQKSQLSVTMMINVSEMKGKKHFLWSESNSDSSRYEAYVSPITPYRYGRSSLYVERGARTCRIRQKNDAPLCLATPIVEHEAFFVRNQMARARNQSLCDQSQSQSSRSQSPNRQRVKVQAQMTTKEALTSKLRVQPSP